MTPFNVKLDFHPIARWVVNGDVVQATHSPTSPTGSINSGVIPSPFQITYGIEQHPVAMEKRHYKALAGYVTTMTTMPLSCTVSEKYKLERLQIAERQGH